MFEEGTRILIVEDSEPMALAYSEFLKSDYASVCLPDLSSSHEFLGNETPLAILLDIQLPDGSGIDLVQALRDAGSNLPVVVMTSDGSVENAVLAIKAGADDFLEKPFSAERLRTTIANTIEKKRLVSLVTQYENDSQRESFEGFIGGSLVMQGVYHMIESAAPSKATVFITGESGTGKEVLAHAIHNLSPRKGKPFIALNCGGIPRDLMESEIFGHLKGAFTGAAKDRKGAALQADQGTLFLDEVCEMDQELQVKLLRFLQTETYRPLGSDTETIVDVRIICATNKKPMDEVRSGRFREDLYYRLHVINIELPPLRDRSSDICLIAESLLRQFSEDEGKEFITFDQGAKAVLNKYHWPGNVRQMQNILRQIVVFNSGKEVTVPMLPDTLFDEDDRCDEARPVDNPVKMTTNEVQPLWKVEEIHIADVLAICDDNVPRAAVLLEVSPSTLYRKLKRTETK